MANKIAGKIEVKCEWCGEILLRHPYRIKRSKHQFCCQEHKQKWMSTVTGKNHPLYQEEKRICLNCGKEFLVKPSYKEKYCSLSCYAEHKKDRGNCVACGKEVKRKGNKYCSRECMSKGTRKRITKTCHICGKTYTIRPCEDRGERNVCSKECSDRQKSLKPQYSDKEMKEYMLLLYKKNGRIPDLNDLRKEMEIDSQSLHWSLYVRRGGLRYWQKKLFGKTTYRFVWEDECIELFNQVLNYPEFQTQKTFPWLKNYDNGKSRPGSLRVDVFYPKHNLCVEFDGEGHFQEINWKKGGTETLSEVQKRDKLKNKLIQQQGLKLIRFKYDEPLTREHVIDRLSKINIDFI